MNYKEPLRLMALKKDFEEEEEDVCSVQSETKQLSSDAIYQILTRVSLGTLLRGCRLVCKDWQKLISETNFQRNHSQRTQIASGYFIQSLNVNGCHINFFPCIADHQYSPQIPSPSLDFLLAKDIKIQGASPYGSLLCCIHKTRCTNIPTYYICKPATREWRKIPKPRIRFSNERIGVVLKQSHPILHYKILRLSTPDLVDGYYCEMFDSYDRAWKRLKDIKLPKYVLLGRECNFLVNGGLHWLTSDHRIFVFHIDQESWTTIELPHEIENNFRGCKTIIHCNGKIGMFYSTKEWMELWILENYCSTKPTWKKKYHKDLTLLPDHNSEYASPVDMYSANIVLMMNDDELIWYNCDDDTYTTTPKSVRDSVSDDFFAFQSGFSYL